MAKNPDPKKKPTPEIDPTLAPVPPLSDEEQSRLDDEAFAELLSDDENASEVDLGRASGGRDPKPPSGQSSTIWADLVKDPSSAGHGSSIDFDAPSDAEVVKNALGDEASPSESDLDILGQAVANPGADSSRVDLFDPPPLNDPLHSLAQPPRREPSEDISGLSALRSSQPVESDINLGPDLPQKPPAAKPSPKPPAAPLRHDSTLRLDEPFPPSGRLSALHGESGIDLGSSSIAKAEPPSRIESGIDLGSAGVIDIDEEAAASAAPLESGVEMGSAAVVDLSSEDDASGAVLLDSGVDLGAARRESSLNMEGAVPLEDSSGLDLADAQIIEDESSGAFAFPPPTGEKMPQPSSDSDMLIGADHAGGANGSAVNLDTLDKEKGSSRDLIAEAVESGVDLGGAVPVSEDEDYDAIVLSGTEGQSDSSSAVDLGGAVVLEDDVAGAGLVHEDLALEMFKQSEEAEVAEEAEEADLELAGAAVFEDEEETQGAALIDEDGGGSDDVNLGGAAIVEDDSAESTLEDKSEADVDNFLSSMGTATDEAKELAGDAETIEDGLGEAVAEEEPFTDAAIETEGEAEKEKEDEEEEYRPPPRPKYGRRWVGGTLVGMILATAACVGLVTFNAGLTNQLGDQVRTMIGYEDDAPADPNKGKVASKKPTGGAQSDNIHDLLKNANFAKDPPPIDENSGEDRAARGEFLWKKYLSKTQPPLKADADEVKKAIVDLTAAQDKPAAAETAIAAAADAFFWQGHIQETLGKRDEALDIYKKAAGRFSANPELKQRFDDSILRIEVLQPAKAPAPPGPGAGAMLPIEFFPFDLEFLPAQQPKPLPEAGPDFWRALKEAAALNFDGEKGAMKTLETALDKHRKRKLSQIGKPQNPFSDPAEEIFVKAGEQILSYWKLQERLKSGNYLAADKADSAKALEALFTDLKTAQADLVTAKKEYATLDAEKKKADKNIETLTTERDTEKKAKDTALADLLTAQNTLKTEQLNLAKEKEKVVAAANITIRLEKDKQRLEETIIGTGEKVGLRDIDPVRSKSILFQKLDDLVEVAKKVDPDNRLASSIVEIRDLNSALSQRWSPEVMLGFWTPLLADRTQKEAVALALKDVERVKANAKAPLESRSQAFAVEGLALRNKNEFAKAKTALAEAMRGDVAGPTWKPLAKEVLNELSDPAASYLPRAEELVVKRRFNDALTVLDEGMKVFADKNGELLALRSQVHLEKALNSNTRLTAATEGLKEALDDAEAAIKAGAEGAGHFAAGRLAEEMGQRPEAELLYRKAMAELPENHPDTAKARLAIARMLLQGIEPKPEPMPKTGKGPDVKGRRLGHFRLPDVAALVLADLPPAEDEAKIKKAMELADEVLARKDIDQLPLLKAQALAVKGMATEALKTYTQGLKAHLSREHYEGLKKLIEEHPYLRRPDVARIAHPMQAEKHYAQGLNRFYNREYDVAEKEFSKAIENFEQDARYFYFLGLSRLAQGKLGAKEDFEQGARLEIDNRPGPGAVNAALERIQGVPRKTINEVRERIR